MKRVASLAILALVVALGSCSGEAPKTGKGVYMLLDTSGTYTLEMKKAQQIINVILARLEPGDSFAVARIDTGSFSEKDIVAKVSFDERPSMANQQKLKFKEDIDKFVKSLKPASYTDITGGILQATEFLEEKDHGEKIIIIFSDMAEDLKKGYKRDQDFSLDGFRVVALNVTKLKSDNFDPDEYRDRLEAWEARVVNGGGEWRKINDLDTLDRIFG